MLERTSGPQKDTAQIGSSFAIMKSDPKTIKTLYPSIRGTLNREKNEELKDGCGVHPMSLWLHCDLGVINGIK